MNMKIRKLSILTNESESNNELPFINNKLKENFFDLNEYNNFFLNEKSRETDESNEIGLKKVRMSKEENNIYFRGLSPKYRFFYEEEENRNNNKSFLTKNSDSEIQCKFISNSNQGNFFQTAPSIEKLRPKSTSSKASNNSHILKQFSKFKQINNDLINLKEKTSVNKNDEVKEKSVFKNKYLKVKIERNKEKVFQTISEEKELTTKRKKEVKQSIKKNSSVKKNNKIDLNKQTNILNFQPFVEIVTNKIELNSNIYMDVKKRKYVDFENNKFLEKTYLLKDKEDQSMKSRVIKNNFRGKVIYKNNYNLKKSIIRQELQESEYEFNKRIAVTNYKNSQVNLDADNQLIRLLKFKKLMLKRNLKNN